jgi:triacylglycerol lipase
MLVPKLRSPVVLIHGILGFNEIQWNGWTLADYFAGIPALLRKAGNTVLVPCLSATGGVKQRARQLRDYLNQRMPTEPVHLIAHSMGGLDSRFLISRLKMRHRVLSLTTLGTPHRGSSFADWSVRAFERLVKPLLRAFGVPTRGFYDLTTARCSRFNKHVPPAPGVRYFSVAGKHDGAFYHPEWLLPYSIVLEHEGPNDGVVSVASATYGESVEVWDGDHFSLVNQGNPLGRYLNSSRNVGDRYAALLARLADEGF